MRFHSPALSINTLFMQFDMQTHFFFPFVAKRPQQYREFAQRDKLPNLHRRAVESRERDNVCWYLAP